MRNFKSLIPVLLTAFVFAGCDTDDLRNDIDELKNRVESLEAQVSAINDNVNALKVFADGGKTISSYEETESGYKLVLSDNTVLNITQGQPGQVDVPEITIQNGNWYIEGKDTGKRAVGDNATLPQFTIKEYTPDGSTTGYYWYVGDELVRDGSGTPVLATTSDDVTIEQDFFESVTVDDATSEMVLVLKNSDGTAGDEYRLPIVEGLKCAINTENLKDYKDGVLTMGFGAKLSIEVEISGGTYILTAPAGWGAELTEPQDGKATLTLTAPASASASTLSRAVADNTKDVVIQVNKGVNWAVDKIQVVAENIIDSYYALFDSGEAIEIAGIELKKSDWESVENFTIKTISSSGNGTDDNKIVANGIYFVQPGATAIYAGGKTIEISNIFIIRDNPNDNTAILQVDEHFGLKGNETSRFLCEGLTFDFSQKNIYAFNLYADFGELIFKNCIIKSYIGQPIFYTGNAFNLKSIVFESCKIDVTGRTQRQLFNIQKVGVESINLKNNVLYSTGDTDVTIQFFNIGNTDVSPILSNFTMENNTLYNAVPSTYGIVTCKGYGTISIKNNLLYSSEYKTYNILLRFFNDTVDKTSGSGETVFNFANKGDKAWKIFNQNDVLEGSAQVNYTIVDMFVDMDKGNGIFIPKDELKTYGAQFE